MQKLSFKMDSGEIGTVYLSKVHDHKTKRLGPVDIAIFESWMIIALQKYIDIIRPQFCNTEKRKENIMDPFTRRGG